MSQNQSDHHNQIVEILDRLAEKLNQVANRDSNISDNEKKFLELVETRIPSIRSELDHIFQDNQVTDEERQRVIQKLEDLFDETVKLSKSDGRVDEEELGLINKLYRELSSVIRKIEETD